MKDIKYDIIFHTQLSPGLRRRLYIAGPEVDPSKMMDQINKELLDLIAGKYPAGKTVDEMLDEIEGKTKDGVPTNYNLKEREDRNWALPTPNVEPSDHLTDVIEQGREVKNEGIDLLPCPFCGKSELSLVETAEVFAREDETIWVWVECSCGVLGPSALDQVRAVRVWNNRVDVSVRDEGVAI